MDENVHKKSVDTKHFLQAAFPKEMQIGLGAEVLLEFYSDDSMADNGDGFRIEWSCENFAVLQV